MLFVFISHLCLVCVCLCVLFLLFVHMFLCVLFVELWFLVYVFFCFFWLRGVILCGFVLVVCVCVLFLVRFCLFGCLSAFCLYLPPWFWCVFVCVCVPEAPADSANCETVKKLNVFSLVLISCAMFLLSVSFVLCVSL